MPSPVDHALALARDLLGKPVPQGVPKTAPSRFFVMGDPQTDARHFFEVLAAHDLLGADGTLQPDAAVLSVGDYFDYNLRGTDVATVALQGAILRWLAAHPEGQTRLLMGNHDAVRVMEFAGISGKSFRAAHHEAVRIGKLDGREKAGAADRFHAAYPEIPTVDVACRDFCSFTESQRSLVRELLLKRRLRLAQVVEHDGHALLVTHAGVTLRELRLLGQESVRSAGAIAQTLNAMLDRSVERVAEDWGRGGSETLDLSPLHVPGRKPYEGGGLLFHRPSDPEPQGKDGEDHGRAASFDHDRPRRFDPRSLPAGLWQIAGHTGHQKCLRELARWVTEDSRPEVKGGLRTLTVHQERVQYTWSIEPVVVDAAGLHLIDPEIHEVKEPARCPLLPVDRFLPEGGT